MRKMCFRKSEDCQPQTRELARSAVVQGVGASDRNKRCDSAFEASMGIPASIDSDEIQNVPTGIVDEEPDAETISRLASAVSALPR